MTTKEKEKKEKQLWLKAFGAHVKKMRLKKDISGAELARLLFMDKPNITRLEKGRVNPSVYLVKQLCDVLHISVDDFFKEFKEK
jgi:putative transcriptional regulator